jgi:hypothetical protein
MLGFRDVRGLDRRPLARIPAPAGAKSATHPAGTGEATVSSWV